MLYQESKRRTDGNKSYSRDSEFFGIFIIHFFSFCNIQSDLVNKDGSSQRCSATGRQSTRAISRACNPQVISKKRLKTRTFGTCLRQSHQVYVQTRPRRVGCVGLVSYDDLCLVFLQRCISSIIRFFSDMALLKANDGAVQPSLVQRFRRLA